MYHQNMGLQGATHIPALFNSLDMASLLTTQPEHPYVAILFGVERTQLRTNANSSMLYGFGRILTWGEKRPE
jgi:hypothetical protein